MTLRELRFHKKVSQLEVAFASGMSQTKLSLIERGYAVAKRRERERIAAALGVQSEQIDWPTAPSTAEVCLNG